MIPIHWSENEATSRVGPILCVPSADFSFAVCGARALQSCLDGAVLNCLDLAYVLDFGEGWTAFELSLACLCIDKASN